MRAEIVLLKMRINMAPQARRRVLVVLIYGGLAALFAGLWFADHWRATGTYIFWTAMLACRPFLGGYYRGGLVKPFTDKTPRQSDAPPPLLALKLRVYQPVLSDDDVSFRNDERELRQRDQAHYQAFQAVGIAVVVAWIVAYMGIMRPAWMASIPMTPYQMFYGLMLVTMLLFITLPQCILLWTEPDMEEPQ